MNQPLINRFNRRQGLAGVCALAWVVGFDVHSALAADATRNITFDTVKFPIEKGGTFQRSMLTDEIKKLDGQRVKIRGYILPTFQQSGLTMFVLVRDNMECCFGPGAALYDCMIVEMKPPKTAEFSTRPVAVEGIFKVSEFLDPDGVVRAVFHLDGESVQ